MATEPGPGTKGAMCTSQMIFAADCTFGLFCEGSWRQAGNQGQCRCNRLFGFYGAQCTELSAVTYVFVALLALVAIYACYVFYTSAMHAFAFYGGKPSNMISSAGGRAIMFSALLPMAVVLNSLVMSLYALQIIRDSVFMKVVASIGNAIATLGFLGSTLSVSVVWFQMVEKASGEAPQKLLMYPGFTVIAIAFAGLVLVVLVSSYQRSSSVIGIFALIFNIILSFTFSVAGRRVAAVLNLPERNENLSSAAQQTQYIAIKIHETASFMSSALAALGAMFLWFALSIPSQRPLYPGQNDVPRLFAGQVALIAVRDRIFFTLLLTPK